jgi:hypothetical protein
MTLVPAPRRFFILFLTPFPPLPRFSNPSPFPGAGSNMKRITYSVVAFATLVAGCNSLALGSGIAQVSVIDRDTGAVLTPHYYHGEYWIAGRPGANYAVEIHNRMDERVLAVASVDGVNVISGETARWDQTGYVLRPDETYQITGWRKSDTEVAAFTFTESPNSYAELTGRPGNVGVIGVALFLERPASRERPAMRERPTPPVAIREFDQPEAPLSEVTAPAPTAPAAQDSTARAGNSATPGKPVPIAPPSSAPVPVRPTAGLSQSESALPRSGPAAPQPASPPQSMPAPPQTAAAASAPRAVTQPEPVSPRSASAALPRVVPQPEPVSPKLGTGHGDREYSFVTDTEFTRRQDHPNQVIRIRYDSFNNLVAMGIIPHPRPPVPTVNPFPGSTAQHYVPDPPTAGLDDLR